LQLQLTGLGIIAADSVQARHFHNYPQSGQLQLQVGDDEDYPDNCHQRGQGFAAVALLKEIGLSVQSEFSACLPNLRQDEKGYDVRQGQVGDDVKRRTTPRIGPAACPQKSECGVN